MGAETNLLWLMCDELRGRAQWDLLFDDRQDHLQQANLFHETRSARVRLQLHATLERAIAESGEAVPEFVRRAGGTAA